MRSAATTRRTRRGPTGRVGRESHAAGPVEPLGRARQAKIGLLGEVVRGRIRRVGVRAGQSDRQPTVRGDERRARAARAPAVALRYVGQLYLLVTRQPLDPRRGCSHGPVQRPRRECERQRDDCKSSLHICGGSVREAPVFLEARGQSLDNEKSTCSRNPRLARDALLQKLRVGSNGWWGLPGTAPAAQS